MVFMTGRGFVDNCFELEIVTYLHRETTTQNDISTYFMLSSVEYLSRSLQLDFKEGERLCAAVLKDLMIFGKWMLKVKPTT